MDEDHSFYWEMMLIQNKELDTRFGLEEAIPSYLYDSSSLEAESTSFSFPLPKNILTERKRRQVLNDKLYAIRRVVPNITKMDKSSIIKDAIDYIQVLQEQEKRMIAEISELEKIHIGDVASYGAHNEVDESRKTKRIAQSSVMAPGSSEMASIEILELKVNVAGDRTVVVSISCSKKRGMVTKVCELFESLNVTVVTVNITSAPKTFLYTLLIESNEMNSIELKELIETAIIALNNIGRNPMRSMSF